jgi:glyoxylase-like metal-dependent hydrolase (beta-lactamase superfamily II)
VRRQGNAVRKVPPRRPGRARHLHPGHTNGSIAFPFEGAGVLFTGDVATRQQGQVVLGPFDNDRPTARQSFRKFADIEVDTVCFGHSQPLVGEETNKLKAAAKADEVPDPLG